MQHQTLFSHGNHICAVYETADEQLATAVEYVAEGLGRNERCLYVADAQTDLDQFRAALSRGGVDVAAEERRGALELRTTDSAHLVEGRFDCERMLGMLNDAVEASLDAGFGGLRTCGDMSWLLRGAPGSDQVVEYEAMLSQFFANVRALGMCQYDRSRLPAATIDMALATHPSVVAHGRHRANARYRPWPSAPSSSTGVE